MVTPLRDRAVSISWSTAFWKLVSTFFSHSPSNIRPSVLPLIPLSVNFEQFAFFLEQKWLANFLHHNLGYRYKSRNREVSANGNRDLKRSTTTKLWSEVRRDCAEYLFTTHGRNTTESVVFRVRLESECLVFMLTAVYPTGLMM